MLGPCHANGVAHCATPSILGVAMGVLPITGSAIEFSKVTIVEASNQVDVPPSLVVGLACLFNSQLGLCPRLAP